VQTNKAGTVCGSDVGVAGRSRTADLAGAGPEFAISKGTGDRGRFASQRAPNRRPPQRAKRRTFRRKEEEPRTLCQRRLRPASEIAQGGNASDRGGRYHERFPDQHPKADRFPSSNGFVRRGGNHAFRCPVKTRAESLGHLAFLAAAGDGPTASKGAGRCRLSQLEREARASAPHPAKGDGKNSVRKRGKGLKAEKAPAARASAKANVKRGT